MGCRRLRTLRCGAIVSLRPRATAAARRITMTMPRPKPGDLLGLVDVDKGIVSREIFVNEEIYRQELHLDLLLDAWDGREGGTEVIGGIHKASTCAWRRSLWNSSRWRRLRQSARQRSPEMPYSDEADERSAGRRSEMLEKLLVQAYCYLALKVMVGILIGATLSWILQARYARLVSSRRPEYTRK